MSVCVYSLYVVLCVCKGLETDIPSPWSPADCVYDLKSEKAAKIQQKPIESIIIIEKGKERKEQGREMRLMKNLLDEKIEAADDT
jgi:hypothetical protein